MAAAAHGDHRMFREPPEAHARCEHASVALPQGSAFVARRSVDGQTAMTMKLHSDRKSWRRHQRD
jgi:hypothetical protein